MYFLHGFGIDISDCFRGEREVLFLYICFNLFLSRYEKGAALRRKRIESPETE
jgi:hypothetical protein